MPSPSFGIDVVFNLYLHVQQPHFISFQGCVEKIFKELQQHILVVVAVTVAMSILQISAVVSACLLARAVSTYA